LKKLILILLLLIQSFLFAQSKYWIFFRDKGLTANASPAKISKLFKEARRSISSRALWRRSKVLNENNLVDYYDIPLNDDYLKKLFQLKVKISNKLKWFNAVSAYLTAGQIEKVKSLPFVREVRRVREFKFKNNFPPEKKLNLRKVISQHRLDYGESLFQLEFSDVPVLHDAGITGRNVRLGFLDSGFNWKKVKALEGARVIAEYDFVFHDSVTANQKDDVPSQHNHGTEIFSIVGGYDPGELIGVAFNAEFVLAKTEDIRSETHVEEDNYAAALEWFENLGVDISSSSLGYNLFDSPDSSYSYSDMNGKTTIVTRAAEIAFQKGMLVITAAGNEGNNSWHYIIAPADGFNTIAVGALNMDGSVASFSSRGPTFDGRIKPDVCALGVSVITANPYKYSYNYVSGTSAATPIVSGISTLILSEFPRLTNKQLRKIILESGSSSSHPNNNIGYGKLSALKAVNFPNIFISGDSVFIQKAFIDSSGFNVNNLFLFASADSSNFEQIPPLQQVNHHYSFLLPEKFSGDSLLFYFTFSRDSIFKRNPSKGFYHYYYGSAIVSRVTGRVIYKFLPNRFYLSNNFPNPFNASTKIEFELPVNSKVNLAIYDILGRRVKLVIDGKMAAGYYSKIIQMGNFASGIYFLRLNAGNKSFVKKIILLK